MIDILPLSNTLIEDNIHHLYLYAKTLPSLCTSYIWSFDAKPISLSLTLDLSSAHLREVRLKCGMNRNSYYQYVNTLPNRIEKIDEFVTLMPIAVLNNFLTWVEQFPVRSRNSYCKLFFYCYHNVHARGHGWSHCIADLSVELGMDHSDVCFKLKQIVAAGFLTRSAYDMYEGIARTYGVNSENRAKGRKTEDENKF